MQNSINAQWQRIYCAITAAVTIQSIIALGTLPILIHAGLPLTPLGFLGNIIFAPFLTLFLVLSFILFIGLLFQVYFSPIAYVLSALSSWWLHVLQYGTRVGIRMYFPVHPWIPQVVCWSFLLMVLFIRPLRARHLRWCLASVTSLLMCIFILKIACAPNQTKVSYCERTHHVEATLHEGAVEVHDYSKNVRASSYEYFLSCTLKPLLAKTFGTIAITRYYIHRKTQPPYAPILRNQDYIKDVELVTS